MAIRSFLGALLSLLPALALADGSAPPIPDSPAGHALSSWLNAFNSGDRSGIESFTRSQASWITVDSLMNWRADVGGYDLLAIYSSERNDIVVRLKARASATEEIGRVVVTATNAALVTELGTYPIPPGATFIGFKVDDATRNTVINTSVARLADRYVFPDAGRAMALAIANRAKQGAYSKTDGESLAKLLTADMREVSHDKHLQVTFRPYRLPAVAPGPGSGNPQTEAKNCAFDKVERLPNNVGYIKFDGFVASDACGDVRAAAMAFLAGVDALIFDLRANRGGGGGGDDKGPDLMSYLFEQPTHIDDFFDRTTGQTTPTWIQPSVPEKRLGNIPVYILTSRMTFSAAEYFTYSLQALKRATVIGEVTGGGAHQTSTERIDDRFSIHVPFGRSINPITKTDWEGVGVIPDVKVPAPEALATAEKLASEELQKRSK
jgi:Peptidase family S41/N-terminal domain of Peptidase_S41 in eukaryotic IRBP